MLIYGVEDASDEVSVENDPVCNFDQNVYLVDPVVPTHQVKKHLLQVHNIVKINHDRKTQVHHRRFFIGWKDQRKQKHQPDEQVNYAGNGQKGFGCDGDVETIGQDWSKQNDSEVQGRTGKEREEADQNYDVFEDGGVDKKYRGGPEHVSVVP